jgi:hypothetical protein
MPGVFKKIKSLLSFVGDKAPFLDTFMPGLGTLVSVGAKGAIHVGEGINRIHTDYTNAKKKKKKYTIFDGIKSGVQGAVESFTSDQVKLDGITKPLGELSDRIKLKT